MMMMLKSSILLIQKELGPVIGVQQQQLGHVQDDQQPVKPGRKFEINLEPVGKRQSRKNVEISQKLRNPSKIWM
ncbi:unnamed protein product [Gongylonema pulchrum]|uniref:Secreted protein n=1 Tax=Gongylonema pulchrum TaxID=637853 RepID=A0A183EKL3_9BILA|nr:unnamed protein product [Gongylonema pulchrum]